MEKIILALCCGLLFGVVYSEHGISKRQPNENCSGGDLHLCQDKIRPVQPTTKTIEYEAKGNKTTLLYKSYMTMTKSSNYPSIVNTGKGKGLTVVETQAVYLYSMTTKVYRELNQGLREGKDTYPVWHFWLQSALAKLPKTQTKLYRGIKNIIKVNKGITLQLPGFTSTADDKAEAETFGEPGCTLMVFDSSRQGAFIGDLSQMRGSTEILIPPTEKFEVYDMKWDGKYHNLYMRPSGRGKRSPSAHTYCDK